MNINKINIGIFGDIHPQAMKFNNSKYKIINIPADNYEKYHKFFYKFDAIIIKTTRLKYLDLIKLNNLKIISKHGVGIDNFDLKYLKNNNIKLTITKNANAVSVAEHSFLLILSLARQLIISKKIIDKNMYKFKKKFIPKTYELFNKKIFIYGYGKIGKELASRCKSFGIKVFIYDPKYKKKKISENIKFVSFNYGIKNADFISIHSPLTNETKNKFNLNTFKKMKKNSIIINTARGGIINEDDLYKAIKDKLIAGAGLDVLSIEPPKKNYKLLKLDNVIITPHSAASTEESRIRMATESLQNIFSFFEKKIYYKKNLIK